MTEPETIDVYEAEALAAELLRELTPHAGNPAAVNRMMRDYADDLDAWPFAAVCMAAVRLTFAECLTVANLDQAPPGALALTVPEEDATP